MLQNSVGSVYYSDHEPALMMTRQIVTLILDFAKATSMYFSLWVQNVCPTYQFIHQTNLFVEKPLALVSRNAQLLH